VVFGEREDRAWWSGKKNSGNPGGCQKNYCPLNMFTLEIGDGTAGALHIELLLDYNQLEYIYHIPPVDVDF
jgi:hypothetical protein